MRDTPPAFAPLAAQRGDLFAEDHFERPSFVSTPGADSAAGGQRHVVKGSIWFVGSVATNAAFGFIFSIIAGRLDKEVFGAASGLWAQIQLVNYLTGMGLPVAIARYGSVRPRTMHALFAWSLLYTTVTSLIGAVVFGVIAGGSGDALWAWGRPAGILLFFVLITGMSFALLVEVRLVTLRQWNWVFGRVLALSLVRLPLLALPFFAHNAVGLAGLLAGLPALTGFLGVVGIHAATPRRDRQPLLPLPEEARPALKFATVNYLGMLAAQAPQFVLPVIVNGYVTNSDYAAYYIAWQITVMFFLVPHTIGQIVLTEASRSVDAVKHQVRLGLQLSLGAMGVAVAVSWVAARFGLLTIVFGPEFELTGALLPRLVAAGVPWAVTCVCLARARVEGDHLRTVAITVGFAIVTVVPGVIMTATGGVDGAAWAWLVGNAAAAALALVVTFALRTRVRGDLVPSGGPAEVV